MLDPIYRLTLHTRGRAHSELLAWFFQRFSDAGERALYRWVDESPDTGHFVTTDITGIDLVAKMPGRVDCLMLCAVLDAPSPERVERMAKSISGGMPVQLLVLSMIDPHWDDQTYWTSQGLPARWIDYRTFLDALNGAASTIHGNEFEVRLIERYVVSMTLTAEVLDSFELHDPHEPIAIDASEFAIGGWHDPHELRSLRLDAVAERIRVHGACAMVRSLSTHGHRTVIEVVSVRGKPTLQQSRQLANGDWIGWQYRGTEWRQFVRTARHSGTSHEDRRRREVYVRNHYSLWLEEVLGLDIFVGHWSLPHASGYTITDPDLVSRSRKLRALSVAEIVGIADHLVTFSYETFER